MIEILIYLSAIFFIYTQGVCNAKQDGWVWDNMYSDGITYGMSSEHWHAWKTQERVFFGSALVIKGYLIGLPEITLLEMACRTLSESVIAWALWHQVYYYTRYGNAWETKYAKNIIYIPGLGKDTFKSLQGKAVIYFHIIRYVIGILGLLAIEWMI